MQLFNAWETDSLLQQTFSPAKEMADLVAVVRNWSFGDHDSDETVFYNEDENIIRQALRAYSVDEK